jgi:hypothetical protein
MCIGTMPAHKLLTPPALPTDSLDVVDALDVARALWEKGQALEAIRWVRRAADCADEGGDASRVASLARAAADLAELPPAEDGGEPSSETRLASRSNAPRASAKVSAPPPPVLPRLSTSTPPPSTAKPPASTSTPSAPRATNSPPPRPTSAPPVPTTTPSRVPASIVKVPAATPGLKNEAGRIRVSVKTSARDPSLLVVRALADGAAAPPGTRVAFLVMPETSSADDVQDLTDELTEDDA